jgi:diguanylate cyclase (GGDEF)-like protein
MYVRKGNIKFIIVQDNLEKTLKIESIERPKGEEKLPYGYNESDLAGHDFSKILAPDTQEIIEDYIEYDFSGADFKEVCDKIINFEIIDSQKTKLEMNLHIERDVSTPERQVFILLLENRLYLRDRIKLVIEAQPEDKRIDEQTGLMHKATYLEVLDETMDFLNDNQSITSLIYTVRIADYEDIKSKHGFDVSERMVEEAAEAIKKGFRSRDVVGYIGDGVFSAIMLRIEDAEALIPLNRFEIKMRSAMVQVSTGINFSVLCNYEAVDLNMEARALVEKCKKSKKQYEIKLEK